MALLYRFTMVALGVGQAKQTLLEKFTDNINLRLAEFAPQYSLFAVPERECNVQSPVGVADSGNAIFAPAISTLPGLIMRKI